MLLAPLSSTLLLTFPDESLEASYAAYLKAHSFSVVDSLFLKLSIGVHVVGFVSKLYNQTLVLEESWRLVESFLIVLIQLLLVNLKLWQKHRTVLGGLFRLLRLLAFTRGASAWIGEAKPSVGSLFKSVVLLSGSLVNVWLPMGVPLMFKDHVKVQALGVAYTLWQTSRSMCVEVLDIGQETLEKSLKSMHDVMLVLGGGPISHDFLPVPSNPALCGRLIVMSQLTIGMLLPTCILYYLEMVSRSAFLADHSHSRNQLEKCSVNLIQAMVFIAVSVACMWSLSSCLIR